ncbi:MAG: YHYH protein [Verrucomicrobia bacterium]|nr:YHYH protein [Verrucomicrobiota bacterium]
MKYDFSVRPPAGVLLAQAARPASPASPAPVAANNSSNSAKAAPFQAFAPKVRTRADANFLYVESDGMPAHNMMVGITAWQQQVPLPQPYTGNNAWRIPLNPMPSKNPVSIKGRFLRGAIALAANGIPIFNPQNNRGEVAQEIGELDQWGGHCGRADDYHYHATPFHLQSVVGKGLPVAYALDGYPIYGLTEPDGSSPTKLDVFNGHELPGLGYHYHGSTKYPYVNGGFHGEVVERDGQVDPQPRAQPMREAGAPLRGARITGFTSKESKSYSLKYEVSGETRHANYTLNDDKSVKFDFVDGRGQVKSETFTPRPRGPGGGQKGKGGQKKGERK